MGKFIGAVAAGLALAAVIVFSGGTAAIVSAGIAFASALGSALLMPKAPKPKQAENTLRSPSAPRIFGYGIRRVYGSYAFYGSAASGASIDVIAYCDCKANSVDAVYLNDDAVAISGGYVQSPDGEMYLGNCIQAGYNLGATPNTVHSVVDTLLPDWGATHRGDGVVSGYMVKHPVKQKHFTEKYPQGDNVQMSLVINMQPVFDPRIVGHDINNESTWAASENPVLHLLHYFVFVRGYDYTNSIFPKISTWIAAANICDEVISGEPRYRACLLFERTAKPKEIIASILETFDGWYSIDSTGQISVYAGAYYAPSITIDSSHIVEYSCQSFVEVENKFNEISVKYFSAIHDYNEVEAQPWRDEGDIALAGAVNATGINPQVPSHKQGRRLAKILMARNNAQYRGQITTNYAGRIAEGHRFINLEIIEAGAVLFDGVAEITEVTRNLDTGGLTISWVNVDANAWAWNPATEDGYGAPTGTYPTIEPLTAPTADTATYAFDGAANTAELTVTGSGPNRTDLTWFLRWRHEGGSVWNEQRYDDIAAGASVTLVAGIVPVNTDLEVQIAYMSGGGTLSDWSNTLDTNADTTATAPDAAASITLASWTSSIALTTPPIPRATSYRWRFYDDDGTTLLRTIYTTNPAVSYWNGEAAADGIRREYVVKVAGVNGAGVGGEASTGIISNAAPDAPANLVLTGSSFNAQIDFDVVTGATGYAIHYHNVTGFDPETEGKVIYTGTNNQIIYGLAAGDYYFVVASYDGWTRNPAFINFTAEDTLNIATGGGAFGTDGGGGYVGDGVGGGGGGINMP